MRKGAESMGRGAGARAWRGVKRARRDDSVWLLSRETGVTGSQSRATSGALALEQSVQGVSADGAARRCALIVVHNPTLADTLAIALQKRYEPQRRVRFIRDSRLLATATHAPEAEITVIDASATEDGAVESFRRLRGAPGMNDTEAIFVASTAMTYELSQLGVGGGVILRPSHSVSDIVSLVSESLATN